MSDESADGPLVPPVPTGAPMAGVPRPRVPRAVLLAALAGLVVGGGGVGVAWGMSSGGSSAGPAFTMRGTMTLTGDNIPSGTNNDNCTGYSGYDDIVPGASVTVYDVGDTIIAVGSLGVGKPSGASCVFPVTVPGVPGGSKFYQVEVSHRGKISVSQAQAKTGLFAATLG